MINWNSNPQQNRSKESAHLFFKSPQAPSSIDSDELILKTYSSTSSSSGGLPENRKRPHGRGSKTILTSHNSLPLHLLPTVQEMDTLKKLMPCEALFSGSMTANCVTGVVYDRITPVSARKTKSGEMMKFSSSTTEADTIKFNRFQVEILNIEIELII